MIPYGSDGFTTGFSTGFGPAPITYLSTIATPSCPYGSFDGKVEQVVVVPDATKKGGAGGWRRLKKRKPWWIVVDGERYKVVSAQQEREIVEAWQERLESAVEEIQAAVAGTQTTKARALKASLTKATKRLAAARIREIEEHEAIRIDRLHQDDEDIITLLTLH